ncbi:hypothetical protein Fmac_017050 [Flemingia macrophylla]|uniref:Flowering locus T n=1 Tax=Flemingia macrophylla TaxID=520843 RepID=A0ABD1M111_9FABA
MDDDPLVVGRIIGDVLEPFTSYVTLRVVYNNHLDVFNSCEFKPSQIINKPRVDIGGDNLRNLYTLIMVNPDAPSPSDPNMKEYLLWLVNNIPATTGATYGEDIVEYECPRPTSGIHRIVFALFRQRGRQIVHAPRWRKNFNTKDFAEAYDLGLPVAAVFFNCQRESGWGGRR